MIIIIDLQKQNRKHQKIVMRKYFRLFPIINKTTREIKKKKRFPIYQLDKIFYQKTTP